MKSFDNIDMNKLEEVAKEIAKSASKIAILTGRRDLEEAYAKIICNLVVEMNSDQILMQIEELRVPVVFSSMSNMKPDELAKYIKEHQESYAKEISDSIISDIKKRNSN